MMDDTARLVARLKKLGGVTDTPGALCRTFLSPAMARATDLVAGWMQEQGAETSRDGWGTLIGHFGSALPEARTLLLGSHLDTVPNAGIYDGPLGVLVALAALEQVARVGVRLPFHVDVLAFSDEEGTRFHSAYLGSKAVAGRVDESDLHLRDAEGVTLAEAVARFQGVNSVVLPKARYDPSRLLGYVEVHIEQGPVLQEMQLPLGVVDAIAAQERLVLTLRGRAGHAGTTPMALRHDALAGAAQVVSQVEAIGRETAGLVATVGQLTVLPGASNVIPNEVRFTVDMRHPDQAVLHEAGERLAREARAIAQGRGLTLERAVVQSHRGVACAPAMIAALEKAVAAQQTCVPRMISGAGHDGVVLSKIAPVGMLFVRCRDGLSHHPDEHVDPADIAAAISALARYIEGLA
jgi:allantoate deiminase